jgi:hypothetical protein
MACNSHKIGFNYPLFITIGDYKMSIFNTILEKLGFNAHAEPAPTIAASPVSSANAGIIAIVLFLGIPDSMEKLKKQILILLRA